MEEDDGLIPKSPRRPTATRIVPRGIPCGGGVGPAVAIATKGRGGAVVDDDVLSSSSSSSSAVDDDDAAAVRPRR